MLRTLRSLSPALAVVALAAPAAAHAAPVVNKKAGTSTSRKASAKKKTVKVVYPTISSISPRKIQVGQKLTVKGTGFKPGKGKSSVAFYKAGQPVIFIKADTATATKLVVTVSPKVADLLAVKNSLPVATLLRLRVIGAKMSRTWTRNSRSPIVSPIPNAPVGQGGSLSAQQVAAQVYQTCQDLAKVAPDGDNDGDSISNGTELANSMDPCNTDTDGDGMSDGYEYDSAQDLNGAAPRYPSKRPWPNPLDPTDVNSDFDGDGLTMWQENKLWKAATGGSYPVTQYSDGTQNSGGKVPTTPATYYLDFNHDGNLTDDERDEDNDGLSNEVEFNTTGTQEWWKDVVWPIKPHGSGDSYVEPPYTARLFNDPDPTVNDTDDDGIADGADDQDNDGWSNFVEMQLSRWQTGYRVNPYNPCLPDPHSIVCSRHPPLDPSRRWAPWDVTGPGATSQMYGDAMPFTWPNQLAYSDWTGAGSPNPGRFNASAPMPLSQFPQANAPYNGSSAWETYVGSHPMSTLVGWDPTEFGGWDPAGWFVGGWDTLGGAQG
jgi:hypothetical protein